MMLFRHPESVLPEQEVPDQLLQGLLERVKGRQVLQGRIHGYRFYFQIRARPERYWRVFDPRGNRLRRHSSSSQTSSASMIDNQDIIHICINKVCKSQNHINI